LVVVFGSFRDYFQPKLLYLCILVRLGIKADNVHHEHDKVLHGEHDGLDDEDIIIYKLEERPHMIKDTHDKLEEFPREKHIMMITKEVQHV